MPDLEPDVESTGDLLAQAINDALPDIEEQVLTINNTDVPIANISIEFAQDGAVTVNNPIFNEGNLGPLVQQPPSPQPGPSNQVDEAPRKVPYFSPEERAILKANITVCKIDDFVKLLERNEEVKGIYTKYHTQFGLEMGPFLQKVRNMLNAAKRPKGKFKRNRGFNTHERQTLENYFGKKFNHGPISTFSAKMLKELAKKNDGFKEIVNNFPDLSMKKLANKIRLCFCPKKQ